MYSAKQMIVVRRDLNMRKGKIAAQAGHACVTAVLMALKKENRLEQIEVFGDHIGLMSTSNKATPLSQWFEYGVAKICVYVDSEEELLEIDQKAKEAGIISALICDGGRTEFHGIPTYTCLALEPQYPEVVDPITGNLPLF
ncbi:MAG: aminoacyl-tRNA hydrolase [Clostridiales bacterium]|nr:aminoacyl-tRNA hydrolase [Clostridiales bacterium]